MAANESIELNLNKQTLAVALAERTGLSRSVAYDAVETTFDIMAKVVAQGGSISITNFGGFSRSEKRARLARNPHTGDPINLPDRKGVKFAVSPRLMAYANSSDPSQATIRKNAKALV